MSGSLRVALSVVIATVAGCGEIEPVEPPGFADAIALPTPVDLSPDPHVLELDLVARETSLELVPAGPTAMWGFDGHVPGPLLEAEVGDRLIVHFHNELPEETTVHWHGIRVPNEMDGVPDHTQHAVQPGDSFEYRFELPDEGLYWYHPHVRSAGQAAAGLYGAIVVRAPDEPVVDEAVLVLSDAAVGDDGALLPADSGGELATLFGREGNVVLVNGRVRPTIRARVGVPLRLRMVNAAIARYFQLALGTLSFTVIGGDRGLHDGPRVLTRPVLTPGQRLDAIVVPQGSVGQTIALRWIPYDRGFGSTEFRDPEDLLYVELERGPDRAVPMPTIPSRPFEPIVAATPTDLHVELTRNDRDGHLALGFDGVPGWEATPFPARFGEVQRWSFRNTLEWSHPIHLHGFFFQPLDAMGRPTGIWADTIDVPVDGSASFLVRFDERPGLWMIHCHVLDHGDAGMMGMIELSR
ncbi:MAG: multicopper oxidase family protein [Sandaracinaceae bacterium]|nr:multicopper oxidase family protein [Sandaracinaceae bacterium]